MASHSHSGGPTAFRQNRSIAIIPSRPLRQTPLWAKSWVALMSTRDIRHLRGRPPSWQNINDPKRGHVHITKLGLTRLMPSYPAKVAPVHKLSSLEAPTRGMTIDPVRTPIRQVWLHWSARFGGTMTQPTVVQVHLSLVKT
jgi:hypothetical protein